VPGLATGPEFGYADLFDDNSRRRRHRCVGVDQRHVSQVVQVVVIAPTIVVETSLVVGVDVRFGDGSNGVGGSGGGPGGGSGRRRRGSLVTVVRVLRVLGLAVRRSEPQPRRRRRLRRRQRWQRAANLSVDETGPPGSK